MARVKVNSAGIKPSDLKAAQVGLCSGIAALATWFTMGIESVVRPLPETYRDTFWLLPFCLTMAALICVHLVQRHQSPTELVGFWILLAASAFVLAGNIGLLLHLKPFALLGSPGSAMIWLAGLACFGVGTLAARVLPSYAGLALILLELVSVLTLIKLPRIAVGLHGAQTGHFGNALAMLAVTLGLRQFARAAAVQGVCYSRLVSAVQATGLSRPEA